jgi:hypothetical protein
MTISLRCHFVEQFARDPLLEGKRERNGVSERGITRERELEIPHIYLGKRREGDFCDVIVDEDHRRVTA